MSLFRKEAVCHQSERLTGAITLAQALPPNRFASTIVAIFFFIFFSCAIQAATVEDFSRHVQYIDVKISPDGKHIAALVNINGNKTLVFFETSTSKITYTINSNRKSQPADYYWVNNERVIIEIEKVRGFLERPFSSGEIYAVNYDGSRRKMIYGYRSKSGIVLSAYGGHVIDILPDDDKHVLIEKRQLSHKTDVLPKVAKLNVYSGKEKRVTTAPIPYSYFLVDGKGVPRFLSGIDENYKTKLFYSKGKKHRWQSFGDEFEGELTPVAFSENNQSVYVLKSTNGAPKSLYKYNLKTEEEILIYESDLVEPTYMMKHGLNQVYGLRLDKDYSSYIYLDQDNKYAQLHKALYSAFKGDDVTITSKTADGKKVIVKITGDRNPGEFYLFDTTTMKAQYLYSSTPWLKAKDLAAMEPFRLISPDNYTLNGFITLPKGKKAKLPTVILPHGGPHSRDYWGYNPQVQMLTNAGYAVVQINFRGSSGYGKAFLEAGYGNWGSKIQDDILLATKYAIQQGVADESKICIFGGSFGGYSALQSAIKSPDLFKCTIGYAGVYDLPMLFESRGIKSITWGEVYLNKTLGTDKSKHIQQSPIYQVDKLKAPVLLIHGEDDRIAPIEHAEKLKEALEQHNHPYEWLSKDKEGHGFYSEANKLEANQKILSFLHKYIGS